jgi:hypothetical protein
VIALGEIAAGECARHSIEHIAVCHPAGTDLATRKKRSSSPRR